MRKIDGTPGYLFFNDNLLIVKLANGKSWIQESNSYYNWTENVVLRIQYVEVPKIQLFITDAITGSYNEALSTLPYSFRNAYIKRIAQVIPFKLNEAIPANNGISRSPGIDGILLIRSNEFENPYKVKFEYTVDLLWDYRVSAFLSREGQSYPIREDMDYDDFPDTLVIYECRLVNGYAIPIRERHDKRLPDQSQTIKISREFLNTQFTIEHLWPEDKIGNKSCLKAHVPE